RGVGEQGCCSRDPRGARELRAVAPGTDEADEQVAGRDIRCAHGDAAHARAFAVAPELEPESLGELGERAGSGLARPKRGIRTGHRTTFLTSCRGRTRERLALQRKLTKPPCDLPRS